MVYANTRATAPKTIETIELFVNLIIVFSTKYLTLSSLLLSMLSSEEAFIIRSPRKSSSTETEYNSAITGSIVISG